MRKRQAMCLWHAMEFDRQCGCTRISYEGYLSANVAQNLANPSYLTVTQPLETCPKTLSNFNRKKAPRFSGRVKIQRVVRGLLPRPASAETPCRGYICFACALTATTPGILILITHSRLRTQSKGSFVNAV